MIHLSYSNHIKPNKTFLGNPKRGDPPPITDEDLKAAVATISHIPTWRDDMAERMFTTRGKLNRIAHGDLADQEIRADFIKTVKAYLKCHSK